MGCNPSCLCLLTQVALRLIKSQSFWNGIKIIVILFWDSKLPYVIINKL